MTSRIRAKACRPDEVNVVPEQIRPEREPALTIRPMPLCAVLLAGRHAEHT